MSRFTLIASMYVVAALTVGCQNEEASVAVPGPAELSGEAIGYYCNMSVTAHRGPKGQIFLSDGDQPLWFTSARDTVAFTMLPEEPRNIVAVYVSDMGRTGWDHSEPGAWVEARKAWYVIGSGRVGGMGAPEPVPFADRVRAEEFSARHGGRVVNFEQIPEDEILGFDDPALDPSRQEQVDRPR